MPEIASIVAAALAEAPPPRLALSPDEAAGALGVSRDFLDEHVMPELRIVRRGRRRIVPVAELEAWLEREAARALEGRRWGFAQLSRTSKTRMATPIWPHTTVALTAAATVGFGVQVCPRAVAAAGGVARPNEEV